MGKKGKLRCDICGKWYATLGCYGGQHGWWICVKCFSQADKLAAKEDRWPDERDYQVLVAQRHA